MNQSLISTVLMLILLTNQQLMHAEQMQSEPRDAVVATSGIPNLTPLMALIDQADYQNFTKHLELLHKATTPDLLGQLLAHALFVSNEPCPPDAVEFRHGIYAIIKLLIEQGANVELICEYLGAGLDGKSTDQCGHGTQATRCSLREFIASCDYNSTAVKNLIGVKTVLAHTSI